MAKKAKKMDQRLLSAQKHEIEYLAKKLSVKPSLVRKAHAAVGRSRPKVTAYIKGFQHGAE
jgi:hypothetical protein